MSLNRGVGLTNLFKREAADGPCVASMTSLNLPERMNELGGGVIVSFNATREGRRGSISEIPVNSGGFGRIAPQTRSGAQ